MPESTNRTPGSFPARLLLYTVFRVLLVVALTAAIIGIGLLIGLRVPILVAVLFSLIIAAPASFLIGKKLRGTVLNDLMSVDSRRRKERHTLQAQLRAQEPDSEDTPASTQ